MGHRVWSVLKGAVDGGLYIPHKVRKFTGYGEPEERGMEYTYDAGAHLERKLLYYASIALSLCFTKYVVLHLLFSKPKAIFSTLIFYIHRISISIHLLPGIMGTHVMEYMEMLQEEDQERYKVQFAKLIEADIEPDAIEDMYRDAMEKIREEPEFERDERTVKIENKIMGNKVVSYYLLYL